MFEVLVIRGATRYSLEDMKYLKSNFALVLRCGWKKSGT